MQKCFYDATKNLHVTDISGLKSKEQIKEEFSLFGLPQEIGIDEEMETPVVLNGVLSKKNFKQESQANIENKKLLRASLKTKFKALNLSDDELSILGL